MRPAGAMECAFLQSLKARLSTAWAPWAGAVPVSSGGGLGAGGLLCSGAGLSLSAVGGFSILKLLAPQESPFLPSWITPTGLTVCTWQSIDAIQDIHPPLLWAASLKYKPVWQMYSSTSFWQLLCQPHLLLFRARLLLVGLFPGLYLSFWFISFVFCGKSGCSIQEQWYNYVRALFPFQRGQSEISRDICLSFGSAWQMLKHCLILNNLAWDRHLRSNKIMFGDVLSTNIS